MKIELTRGLVTQVDTEFDFLDQYKWYALKVNTNANFQYYAVRKISINRVQSIMYLHRAIIEIKLGRPLLRIEQIDHVNHDGLRNTLDNLRIVTSQQNKMNQRRQNRYTYSQFKGVTYCKNRSKWKAQIQKDGKNMHLGCFVSEKDAAHAYDTAAKLYFGEYACLNFTEKLEC
ncbi:MAG: HNH endonuclease [Candidatus Methanomethylophilaceae archaeon]|jgi:hypothetical protein